MENQHKLTKTIDTKVENSKFNFLKKASKKLATAATIISAPLILLSASNALAEDKPEKNPEPNYAQMVAEMSQTPECKSVTDDKGISGKELITATDLLRTNSDIQPFNSQLLCAIAKDEPLQIGIKKGESINQAVDDLLANHSYFKSVDETKKPEVKNTLFQGLNKKGYRVFDKPIIQHAKITISDNTLVDMYRKSLGLSTLVEKRSKDEHKKTIELELLRSSKETEQLMRDHKTPEFIAKYFTTKIETLHEKGFGGTKKPIEEQLISTEKQNLMRTLNMYRPVHKEYQKKKPRGHVRLGGAYAKLLGEDSNSYNLGVNLRIANDYFNLTGLGFFQQPFLTSLEIDKNQGGGIIDFTVPNKHRALLMVSTKNSSMHNSYLTSDNDQQTDSLDSSEFYLLTGGHTTLGKFRLGLLYGLANTSAKNDSSVTLDRTDTLNDRAQDEGGVVAQTNITTKTNGTVDALSDILSQAHLLELMLGYSNKGFVIGPYGDIFITNSSSAVKTTTNLESVTTGTAKLTIDEEVVDQQEIGDTAITNETQSSKENKDELNWGVGLRLRIPYAKGTGLFSAKLGYDSASEGVPLTGFLLWTQNFGGIEPLVQVGKIGDNYLGRLMIFTDKDNKQLDRITNIYETNAFFETVALDPRLRDFYFKDSFNLLTHNLKGMFGGGSLKVNAVPSNREDLTGGDSTKREVLFDANIGYNDPRYAGGFLDYNHDNKQIRAVLNINAIPHVNLQILGGSGEVEPKQERDVHIGANATYEF